MQPAPGEHPLLTPEMIAAARASYRAMSEADQIAYNEYFGQQPATIDAAVFPDWEQVAPHFPASGPPGLTYSGVRHTTGVPVNCLLHWDDDGRLAGVLNQYPEGIPGELPPHAANVLVRPDRQGRGIGTLLVVAAMAYGWRTAPSTDANPYSAAGRAATLRARRYFAVGTPGYVEPGTAHPTRQ